MLHLVIVVVWAGTALQAAGLTVRSSKQDRAAPEWAPAVKSIDPQHSCLDNQRIVFLGPSTSKADYLALTFFAEYGRWPDQALVHFGEEGVWAGSGPNPLYGPQLEYGFKIKGEAPPKPVGPCKAGSAEEFHWYSNRILNGHEVCDCYKVGGWEGPLDVNNQTENRVYSNGKTTIAYFQWFGDVVSPRGTFSFWPLQQMPPQPVQQQCPAGQFRGSWEWSMPLAQFISSTVVHFQPTHLVVDAAFWPIQPDNKLFWDGVANAGVSAVLNTHGKVLWRTAPTRADYPSTGEHSSKVDTSGFTRKGWQLYDASEIVKEYEAQVAPQDSKIFLDSTHLLPKAQCFLMQSFLERHVCPAH